MKRIFRLFIHGFLPPLMIINDLYAIGMAPTPLKHQSPLVINPEEWNPFHFQTLQLVAGGYSQLSCLLHRGQQDTGRWDPRFRSCLAVANASARTNGGPRRDRRNSVLV